MVAAFCSTCINNQNIILSILQNADDDEEIDRNDLQERYPICCENCQPMVEIQLEQKNKIYGKPVPRINQNRSRENDPVDYLFISYQSCFVNLFVNQILTILNYEHALLSWTQDFFLLAAFLFLSRPPRNGVLKEPKSATTSYLIIFSLIVWRVYFAKFCIVAMLILSLDEKTDKNFRTGTIKYAPHRNSPDRMDSSPQRNPDDLIDSFCSLSSTDDGMTVQRKLVQPQQQPSTPWKGNDWTESNLKFSSSQKWTSPFAGSPFKQRISFGHTPTSIKWATKPVTPKAPTHNVEPSLTPKEMLFKPQKFPSLVLKFKKNDTGLETLFERKIKLKEQTMKEKFLSFIK